MKLNILLMGLLFSTTAISAENATVTGTINHIKFFPVGGESGVFIQMDGLDSPSGCGDTAKRVLIKGDHPSFNAVLSAALAAKMSNATVRLNYKFTCDGKSDSWDFNNFQIN
jgi:hypothetical protein